MPIWKKSVHPFRHLYTLINQTFMILWSYDIWPSILGFRLGVVIKINVLGNTKVLNMGCVENVRSPKIVEQVVYMCFGVILVATPAMFLALTASQFHHSVAIHIKRLQPPLMVKHGDLLHSTHKLLCLL